MFRLESRQVKTIASGVVERLNNRIYEVIVGSDGPNRIRVAIDLGV